MGDLFETLQSRPKGKQKSSSVAFIFDWDVDEQDGEIVGIIRDIQIKDSKGRGIPRSSLIREELGDIGWEAFLDRDWRAESGSWYGLNVSGRFRWEGTYWAHQDYWGEWDCGWDIISLEPADRRTRRAVELYGKGWDELPRRELCQNP